MSAIVSILYPQDYDVLYGTKRLPRLVRTNVAMSMRLPEMPDLETVAFYSNPRQQTETLLRDGEGGFWRCMNGAGDGVPVPSIPDWFRRHSRRINHEEIPLRVRAVARGARARAEEPDVQLPDGETLDTLPRVREITPREDYNIKAMQIATDRLKEFGIHEGLLVRRCVEPVLTAEFDKGWPKFPEPIQFLAGTSLSRKVFAWRLDALDALRRAWDELPDDGSVRNSFMPGVRVDVVRPDLLDFDADLHRARLAAEQMVQDYLQKSGHKLREADANSIMAFVWLRDALKGGSSDLAGYADALAAIGWTQNDKLFPWEFFGTEFSDLFEQARAMRPDEISDEDAIALLPGVGF